MRPIVIVDYGMANLRSVQKAFERVEHPAIITGDSNRVAEADKLVVPGVEPVSCAIACIVVVTAIAMFSVRMNAWVTGILLAIGMVALVLTGALGFLRPHQDLVQVLLLHPVMAGPHGRAEPTTLLAMGS